MYAARGRHAWRPYGHRGEGIALRIRQSLRRTHRRARADGVNWLSFSDLMSSLLLIFVLIMFYIMYQYFDMYEVNMAEIARQQYDLDQANASLDEKTAKLTLTEQQMIAQQIKLDAAQRELESAQIVLAAAQSDLETAQTDLQAAQQELATQRDELTTAQSLLTEKEQKITQQTTELSQLSEQLDQKQAQITQQQRTLDQQQATMNDQKQTLANQQRTLNEQQATMDAQKQTLEQQQQTLADQQATMDTQKQTLEQQRQTLADQQATMDTQRQKLEQQQTTLEQQQATMAAQQSKLEVQQQTLEDQQAQIEQLVGLRPKLIASLSNALREANISAQVDPTNGSIALESDVLFETGKSVLTQRGRDFIDRFLPVYLKVLLSEDYRPYVTEIIIEGHTDSTGTYISNLKLSQERALAMASYVLTDDYRMISASQKQILRKLATANGRSESDPVLDARGRENLDASRRVVFKFRMTDEQMISQLKDIMEKSE